MSSETTSWMKDYEKGIMLFLSNFLAESNNFDLTVSLLRGKNADVEANKMVFPTRLFKKILTFLKIVSTYFSAFNKIGMTSDEFYSF